MPRQAQDSAVRFSRPAEVRPDIAYRTKRSWVLCEVQRKLDWEIVEGAIDVTCELSSPLREAQQRAIFSVLSEKMKSRLREAAMHPDRIPESPSTRKLRLFLESVGEKRGRAEGLQEGRAESKREDLLTILEERGLVPTTGERGQIERCEDVVLLSTWLKRAIGAASVGEVLRETGASGTERRGRTRARRAASPRKVSGKVAEPERRR
ncbi:MAG: hypothetical protein R3B70_21080 [Polyangiaceae bacterium]